MNKEMLRVGVERANNGLDVLEKLIARCIERNNNLVLGNDDARVRDELFTDRFQIVPAEITVQVGIVLDEFWRMVPLIYPAIKARVSSAPAKWWNHALEPALRTHGEPNSYVSSQIISNLIDMRGNKDEPLQTFIAGLVWIARYKDRKLFWEVSAHGVLPIGAKEKYPKQPVLSFDFDVDSGGYHPFHETLREILPLIERHELACLRFFRNFLDRIEERISE